MTMPPLPPILARAAAMYEGEPLADEVHAYARQYAAEVAGPLVAALRGLVYVYVTEGAAVTPARDIGDAWSAAHAALATYKERAK